ncbi:MAG: exonuclease domain-containing protein [Bacteriovorax sp.]
MKLSDLPVFFLDLQTTGSRPESGHILEIAWASARRPTMSFLVEQPQNVPVPRRIKMLTGVKDEDMENATPFPEIMIALQDFIASVSAENAICIIHFAQFERPFLKAAFARFTDDIPFPIICTHEIAKRLFPNLPSRGIKGLAGFFGDSTGEFKRAHSHVEATKLIWENLMPALLEKGIKTTQELNEWLVNAPKLSRTKYEYPLPKEKRLNLPDVPGIYRMLNSKGEVLYVGKATSLHDRVNSYFRGQKKRDSRKLEMLAQVYDLRVTECGSPLEAALLETDEIKRLNPYYNIALKVGLRSLVFFNRDFTSMSDTSGDGHTIGPFSNALTLEPMLKLAAFVNNRQSCPLLPEDMFFETFEPQLLKDGLDLFCVRNDLELAKFSSIRSIMAQGLLWERQLKSKEKMAEEVPDETAETEIVITPFEIAEKFKRHFIRVGRAYLRSRKMNELMNSDILFKEKDGDQQRLSVRNGKIMRASVDVIFNSPWENESIETYDRMTVLMTELERVRSQEGEFTICPLALN